MTPPRGVCYTKSGMKNTEQRINNIIGQLNGIKKMLQNEKHGCFDLIVQLKAVKSAMSSLMQKMVAEEMDSCWREGKKDQQNKVEKILKELIN